MLDTPAAPKAPAAPAPRNLTPRRAKLTNPAAAQDMHQDLPNAAMAELCTLAQQHSAITPVPVSVLVPFCAEGRELLVRPGSFGICGDGARRRDCKNGARPWRQIGRSAVFARWLRETGPVSIGSMSSDRGWFR